MATTKNKRRKPAKQHAGKKQKETAYDRISRETDELMWEVATVADKLLDLLPAFRRLSEKNRRLIFDHMQVVVDGLLDSVDDYYDTLPESEECEDCSDDAIDAAIALGFLGAAAKVIGDALSDQNKEPSYKWPDAIDIEGRRVEPEQPKQLKSKGD